MIRERVARLIGLLLMAALCVCAPPPRPLTTLTVVVDPGRFASVVEAAHAEAQVNWWDSDWEDDDACTASFAATELLRFLPGCFHLPATAVRVAAALPDTGDAIVLGDPRTSPLVRSLMAGSDLSPGFTEGFRLRALERDGRRLIVIAGNGRAGVLYGAYALLDQLGTRFPGLGDTGRVEPRAPAVWPRHLSRSETPAIATRGFWAFEPRGNPEFFVWMARNRLNQWTASDTAYVPLMKKLGFQLTGGGHTIQSEFLPPSRYFASHPEWFGLHAGRRSPAIHGESGDNFCTSNREARRELAHNLAHALIDGALKHVDLLELWMLDGGRWCECDSCRAQGPPTDRLLDVTAEVATELEEAESAGGLARPVTVSTLAYLETLPPPARPHGTPHESRVQVTFFPYFRCYAHGLLDSTCTEINRRLAAAWNGWVAWRGWDSEPVPLAVCEYYDVGAFKTLPLIFPHVMVEDFGGYGLPSSHVTRFEYMHAPTRAWGCWTLDHWLISRLAWDPRQNADSLVARFCRDYFPSAAMAMREHYRWLELASANILALQHCVGVYGTSAGAGGRLAQPAARLYPLKHLQARETHPPLNDGPDLDQIEHAMREARAALERALALASESVERARLTEEERRFAYGQATFALYVGLIHSAECERAGDTVGLRAALEASTRAAGVLRQVTDLVQVSASHANARDGLEGSGVAATFEYFRRRYAR